MQIDKIVSTDGRIVIDLDTHGTVLGRREIKYTYLNDEIFDKIYNKLIDEIKYKIDIDRYDKWNLFKIYLDIEKPKIIVYNG